MLKGKSAVITGGVRGIGRAIAEEFCRQGADVLLCYRSNEAAALKTAEELKQYGTRVELIKGDVSDPGHGEAAVKLAVEIFGKIDILLNNAGVAIRGGVCDLCVEEWDMGMDVNVKGIFLVSKHVIPHMIENKYGKIVNTSSINSIAGDKDDMFIRHVYNASKAAVRGLTMGMACSYGKYGITVNAVGPGLFESEMTADTLFKSDEFLKAYSRIVPLNRPARKGELNGAILFLSSDASSYITGQTIFVDGGFSIV